MQDKLTVKSILSLFQTNKIERAAFVSEIISVLENKGASSLNVHIQAKAMIEIAEALISNNVYREILLKEVEENGKNFDYQNAKFSIKETGVKYIYTNTDDLELVRLQNEAFKANEKLKERQKFLQALPLSGIIYVDEVTGETYKIYPPYKESTTAVTITLK